MIQLGDGCCTSKSKTSRSVFPKLFWLAAPLRSIKNIWWHLWLVLSIKIKELQQLAAPAYATLVCGGTSVGITDLGNIVVKSVYEIYTHFVSNLKILKVLWRWTELKTTHFMLWIRKCEAETTFATTVWKLLMHF